MRSNLRSRVSTWASKSGFLISNKVQGVVPGFDCAAAKHLGSISSSRSGFQKKFQRKTFSRFVNCTALVAVTSLTLDSARAAGSESLFGKKFALRFLLRRKKFMLLCRTVEFEILLHNVNRAQHNRYIPKYTKSSISQQLNSTFTQAPSASRRDAAAGIS